MLNIVKQAHKQLKRTAIVADNRSYTYQDLLFASGNFASILLDKQSDLNELNTWMRTQMPAYKTPRKYKLTPELPRNAMGKVTKNDVKKLF